MAISPQYRFAPKHTFPAQVHDVKAAVRWLRAHKDEYKVDPDQIGAVGFSAGGHLSLMLGADRARRRPRGGRPQGRPQLEGPGRGQLLRPDRLRGDGPPRRHQADRQGLPRRLRRRRSPRRRPKASPLTFVTPDDPPILTFQGTKDPLVPHTQAEKLTDAMTKAGVPGRTELLIGKGHGWGDPEMRHTLAETFAFFDRYLKPARTP